MRARNSAAALFDESSAAYGAGREHEEQVRRRVVRRLLPYVILLFVVAYLDRVSLSFTALDMSRELHVSPQVYGFGAGIFLTGYFLLEIPGPLIVEHWHVRRQYARRRFRLLVGCRGRHARGAILFAADSRQRVQNSDSGHDISLSQNRHLQVEDAVACSNAFVDQVVGNVPANCFYHKETRNDL